MEDLIKSIIAQNKNDFLEFCESDPKTVKKIEKFLFSDSETLASYISERIKSKNPNKPEKEKKTTRSDLSSSDSSSSSESSSSDSSSESDYIPGIKKRKRDEMEKPLKKRPIFAPKKTTAEYATDINNMNTITKWLYLALSGKRDINLNNHNDFSVIYNDYKKLCLKNDDKLEHKLYFSKKIGLILELYIKKYGDFKKTRSTIRGWRIGYIEGAKQSFAHYMNWAEFYVFGSKL